MEKNTALAVIPARGGSKRLPRKNVMPLNGKPLICFSIDTALSCGCFTDVMVSSEDEEILEIAGRYPKVLLDKRSDDLAGDTVKVIDVIKELVARPQLQNRYSTISLLLPTCPFRRIMDIQKSFSLLTEDSDGVVAVTTYDFPYTMSAKIDEKGFLKYVASPSPLVTGNTRSQDHAPVYHPNGAIYTSRWNHIMEKDNFFHGRVKGYAMPEENSIEIDTMLDFKIAELMIKNNLIDID